MNYKKSEKVLDKTLKNLGISAEFKTDKKSTIASCNLTLFQKYNVLMKIIVRDEEFVLVGLIFDQLRKDTETYKFINDINNEYYLTGFNFSIDDSGYLFLTYLGKYFFIKELKDVIESFLITTTKDFMKTLLMKAEDYFI